MSGRTAKAARAAARAAADRAVADLDAAVEGIWSRVPDAGCRGLCGPEVCGPIGMSGAERDRIERRHGIRIENGEASPSGRCPALADDGRCRVYADRPTLCRIWSTFPSTACRHGCRPTTGLLPDRDAAVILQESMEVDVPPAAGGPSAAEVVDAVFALEQGPELFARAVRGDRSAVRALALALTAQYGWIPREEAVR